MLTGEHPKYSFEQFLNVSQLLIFFLGPCRRDGRACSFFFKDTSRASQAGACRSLSSRALPLNLFSHLPRA